MASIHREEKKNLIISGYCCEEKKQTSLVGEWEESLEQFCSQREGTGG